MDLHHGLYQAVDVIMTTKATSIWD